VPVLTEVRRFVDDDGTRRSWEETAATGLRVGDESVIGTYLDHGRILDGDRDDMLTAAYTRWRIDHQQGRSALLIAGDNDTVTQLNERARADFVAAGSVDDTVTVALRDGTRAGRGDRIITREIDRYIADAAAPEPPVKPAVAPTGSSATASCGRLIGWPATGPSPCGCSPPMGRIAPPESRCRRPTSPSMCSSGYASTAHRAQGMTVDTAHTVVTTSQTREVLYLAATRGRRANLLYVATDPESEIAGDTPCAAVHRAVDDAGGAAPGAVSVRRAVEPAVGYEFEDGREPRPAEVEGAVYSADGVAAAGRTGHHHWSPRRRRGLLKSVEPFDEQGPRPPKKTIKPFKAVYRADRHLRGDQRRDRVRQLLGMNSRSPSRHPVSIDCCCAATTPSVNWPNTGASPQGNHIGAERSQLVQRDQRLVLDVALLGRIVGP
jgi:hypothetical protein